MKSLGKITFIRLGCGGYQDAMFGLTVGLDGKDGGCTDFIGTWPNPEGKDDTWIKGQQDVYLKVINKIKSLMEDSKVSDLNQLVNKPVEIQWSGPNGQLVSWRILKEVI